jgi:hypothetical protein
VESTNPEVKNSFELESEIPVFDTIKPEIDISFFPEGGYLLAGTLKIEVESDWLPGGINRFVLLNEKITSGDKLNLLMLTHGWIPFNGWN